MKKTILLNLSLAICLLLLLCAKAEQEVPDAIDTFEIPKGDIVFKEKEDKTDAFGPRWKKPQGYATITFFVDDSRNKTYKDGDIKWNASFKWDEKTNIVVYSSSWMPEDGPFPPLYDDGPISEGGHEMEGSKKGDNIFSTEVYFKADEETTFEYGAINEFDNWIWIGPNGEITVPKNSTDRFDAKGLVLPSFGDVDFKLTLDIKSLHEQFKQITPDTYNVYLKGSMNSWMPVQLLDNGEKGDEVSGDGIFTYIHSKNLGPHDGLLYDGQHAQFVFVFALQGIEPKAGLEYKYPTTVALSDGIKAYSDYGSKGNFHEEQIIWEKDSKGVVFNTTVIIGEGKPWCKTDKDCYEEGANCKEGFCEKEIVNKNPKILFIDPQKGPTTGGTNVTITGENFQEGIEVMFGDALSPSVTFNSSTEIIAKTPAYKKGLVDVTVTNPDKGSDTFIGGFEYVEEEVKNFADWGKLNEPLEISVLKDEPAEEVFAEVYEKGVTEGAGKGFSVIAEAGYGAFSSDPSKDPSLWKWSIANYGGESGNNDVFKYKFKINEEGVFSFTFRFSVDDGENYLYVDSDGTQNGFSFEKIGTIEVKSVTTGPYITAVEPNFGKTTGGEIAIVKGKNFVEGTEVRFGELKLSSKFKSAEEIEITTPEHAVGWVSVEVKNPDNQTNVKKKGFLFVPKATPVIDGKISDDWHKTLLAVENNIESNWDPLKNSLKKLYFAYDEKSLYFGIDGIVEKGNYILGFIDPDNGKGTGYADMTKLSDNYGNGDLDDALSSNFKVNVFGYGADFAFGTTAMESVSIEGNFSAFSGCRAFKKHDNFDWIKCEISANSQNKNIEVNLPLKEVFPKGIPKEGTHIGIFVRLCNNYGNYASNQGLPSSGVAPFEVKEIYSVEIR